MLDAAATLFLQRGLSVTMDAIAAQARVSKRTLYALYPDKMALFMAVLDWLSSGAAWPALAADPSKAGLEEALTAYGWALYEHYATPKIASFLRLLQKEKERIPDLERRMREEVVRTQIAPLQALLAAQSPGALRNLDTPVAATAFVRLVIGEIAEAYARGGPPDRAAFAGYLHGVVDLFLYGLAAPRPQMR